MSNAFFYNSIDDDRVYDADSFSDWLRKFFTTGVFAGDLQVKAKTGMQITIGSGYCNIDGKVKMWTEETTLAVPTADATYARIDTIVVERNDTERNFYLKLIQGTAGSYPKATEPVRQGNIYQLVLAQIRVNAGATSITQANITDKRADTSVCGIVAAAVKQIDFSQIQAQYDSYISEFKSTEEAAFGEWFESVKGKMTGDAGTNLAKTATANEEWIRMLYHMIVCNDVFAPVLDSDGNPILDSAGNVIVGGLKYAELGWVKKQLESLTENLTDEIYEDIVQAGSGDTITPTIAISTGEEYASPILRQPEIGTSVLTIFVKNSVNVTAGSNLFRGQLVNPEACPRQNVTGVGYYGSTVLVGEMETDGTITVRACGSIQKDSNVDISFTYHAAGYAAG